MNANSTKKVGDSTDKYKPVQDLQENNSDKQFSEFYYRMISWNGTSYMRLVSLYKESELSGS